MVIGRRCPRSMPVPAPIANSIATSACWRLPISRNARLCGHASLEASVPAGRAMATDRACPQSARPDHTPAARGRRRGVASFGAVGGRQCAFKLSMDLGLWRICSGKGFARASIRGCFAKQTQFFRRLRRCFCDFIHCQEASPPRRLFGEGAGRLRCPADCPGAQAKGATDLCRGAGGYRLPGRRGRPTRRWRRCCVPSSATGSRRR